MLNGNSENGLNLLHVPSTKSIANKLIRTKIHVFHLLKTIKSFGMQGTIKRIQLIFIPQYACVRDYVLEISKFGIPIAICYYLYFLEYMYFYQKSANPLS